MTSLFPETWSSVLLTGLLGLCAYFAICWIRLKEKQPHDSSSDETTILDIVYNDFKSIISLFSKKEEESKNEEKKSKDIKAPMRRGGSSNNLKAEGKNKKKLLRQNSSGTIDLHISKLLLFIIINRSTSYT